ncbi:uncharacterized protein zgc:194930 isoform X2 [Thalassophryne amazonica]|nr:uncharacterized protein zgc:194930 isoform X2 [Thalassophryne amazonica]
MGCRCCRMIKSYIYDPSVPTDGRKGDTTSSSFYQPESRHNKQKQGVPNMGYSKSHDSTLKLESDNNHINHRLHAAPADAKELQQGTAPPTAGGLYIIHPEAMGPRWVMQEKGPSQVPVYPNIHEYENQPSRMKSNRKGADQPKKNRRDNSALECVTGCESLTADETDEGVGGTPEYPCDTGDEGSVLSVDIHTSTTSLSSADTKDDHRLPKTPDASTVESGISMMKSEDEEEVQSVTDSMVAEALAALEAATAGEDSE